MMNLYSEYNNRDLGYENRSYLHMDRLINANIGKFTHGISPFAIHYAFMDWSLHLLKSPGKQTELFENAASLCSQLALYTGRCCFSANPKKCIEPGRKDRRFIEDEWEAWPYNFISQSFLLTQKWWEDATRDARGVTKHHTEVVSFSMRQLLDVLSPSNYIFTNPVILSETVKKGGMNLLQGWKNFTEDYERFVKKEPPVGSEKFVVGENLACTPGKVIYRNYIMELIQYEPKTKKVRPEPILIVPAWIMKYYVLDLSQENSLVKYLLENGYTVFMISWKNFKPVDRDIRMLDYRENGVMQAIKVINQVCKGQKIHAMGYCLGGTLLSIAAAHIAREKYNTLKTITMLATQTDFTEAGELTLFIDESQVSFLEDLMWDQGVLDSKQLAGTFQMLRSKDLIWSKIIHDYLLGRREGLIDLMAWNADATRLPFKMHSQYLRELFLNNDLAEGRYVVGDRPIALTDIKNDIFCVGTVKDHIAPWKSVFKINLLSDTDVTFLLTSGGHNAGIISEPGHPRRTYQISTRKEGEIYTDPKEWQEEVPIQKGSWWPEYIKWLDERSSETTPPPKMGIPGKNIVMDAPGSYVLES